MLKSFNVTAKPILPSTTIANVGKMNVICGKNNSGKTTLIKAIADKKKVVPGVVFDKKYVAKTIDNILTNIHPVVEKNGAIYNELVNSITEALKTKIIWFESDLGNAVNIIFDTVKSNTGIVRINQNHKALVKEIKTEINNYPGSIFIPPKRNLELRKSFQSEENPEPKGNGILNALFALKNQPEATVDNKKYQIINDAFKSISGGYIFDIHLVSGLNNQIELSFKSPNNNDTVSAENSGLGLQDIIVIIFFSVLNNGMIICIEEPESHIHPEMQRKLLMFLKEYSNNQFFLTTHSNVFLDNSQIDKILFTNFSDSIHISDETSRAYLLDDLGYSVSDNLVSDVVILVEGPSDVPVIERFLQLLELQKHYNIKIWPLGGDIMDQIDLSIVAENRKVFALIDSDYGSKKIRENFKRRCKKEKIPVHQLKYYALENYFTFSALKKVYGNQLPENFEKVQPRSKLEKQISFNPKKRNRQIANNMNLDDIKDTDLFIFFQKIKRLCEKN